MSPCHCQASPKCTVSHTSRCLCTCKSLRRWRILSSGLPLHPARARRNRTNIRREQLSLCVHVRRQGERRAERQGAQLSIGDTVRAANPPTVPIGGGVFARVSEAGLRQTSWSSQNPVAGFVHIERHSATWSQSSLHLRNDLPETICLSIVPFNFEAPPRVAHAPLTVQTERHTARSVPGRQSEPGPHRPDQYVLSCGGCGVTAPTPAGTARGDHKCCVSPHCMVFCCCRCHGPSINLNTE